MALTTIVITFGVTALLLAMAYRSWLLDHDDDVPDDITDRAVARGGWRDQEVDDEADLELAPAGRTNAGIVVTALVPLPMVLPILGAAMSILSAGGAPPNASSASRSSPRRR